MYDNLQEKHKSNVFQILKMTIRKKIHWALQMFGNKFVERSSLTSKLNIQIN